MRTRFRNKIHSGAAFPSFIHEDGKGFISNTRHTSYGEATKYWRKNLRAANRDKRRAEYWGYFDVESGWTVKDGGNLSQFTN